MAKVITAEETISPPQISPVLLSVLTDINTLVFPFTVAVKRMHNSVFQYDKWLLQELCAVLHAKYLSKTVFKRFSIFLNNSYKMFFITSIQTTWII